jgi:CTP:molybdopterin cytidylyltransferase MocA
MGEPKLLLPAGDGTVISLFLGALAVPEITETVIVIRKDDVRLKHAVDQVASIQGTKVTIIQPDVDPPEMRTSVAHAITHLKRSRAPNSRDACLLSPADHPALDRNLIVSLTRRWQTIEEQVLVPACQGLRGHPILLSWELAARIDTIPAGEGINWLVRQSPTAELEVPSAEIFADLDTPDDYTAFQLRWKNLSSR